MHQADVGGAHLRLPEKGFSLGWRVSWPEDTLTDQKKKKNLMFLVSKWNLYFV